MIVLFGEFDYEIERVILEVIWVNVDFLDFWKDNWSSGFFYFDSDVFVDVWVKEVDLNMLIVKYLLFVFLV